MESKYLLEVTEDRLGYYGDRAAAYRLWDKCKGKDTIVAVHIKNPRCSVKD